MQVAMSNIGCTAGIHVEVIDANGHEVGIYETGEALILFDAPTEGWSVLRGQAVIATIEPQTGMAELPGPDLTGETLFLRMPNGTLVPVGLGVVPLVAPSHP